MTDVTTLIDVARYPVTDLVAPATQVILAAGRRALAEKGVALLPGFLRPDAITAMTREALTLRSRAHLENVYGSPYMEVPDESYPEGHPRRSREQSRAWIVAYDLIPSYSPLRALYEWDPLMYFVSELVERRPLYRSADRLGALNLAVMTSGHQQGWQFDTSEFAVSLTIQSSQSGGRFECAPFIRSADDENYDEVAHVLRGTARHRIEVVPLTAGALMVFAGRYSLHRVTAVQGGAPYVEARLAYDTEPDRDSSDAFKSRRYGRVRPLARVR